MNGMRPPIGPPTPGRPLGPPLAVGVSGPTAQPVGPPAGLLPPAGPPTGISPPVGGPKVGPTGPLRPMVGGSGPVKLGPRPIGPPSPASLGPPMNGPKSLTNGPGGLGSSLPVPPTSLNGHAQVRSSPSNPAFPSTRQSTPNTGAAAPGPGRLSVSPFPSPAGQAPLGPSPLGPPAPGGPSPQGPTPSSQRPTLPPGPPALSQRPTLPPGPPGPSLPVGPSGPPSISQRPSMPPGPPVGPSSSLPGARPSLPPSSSTPYLPSLARPGLSKPPSSLPQPAPPSLLSQPRPLQPPLSQPGPPISQPGLPMSTPVPLMAQPGPPGPPMSQPGPPMSHSGPLMPQPGPSMPQPGLPMSQPGPPMFPPTSTYPAGPPPPHSSYSGGPPPPQPPINGGNGPSYPQHLSSGPRLPPPTSGLNPPSMGPGGGPPMMGGGGLPPPPPIGGGGADSGGFGTANGSIPPSVHASAHNRFGGNMQDLSSKLGGLSVTQMGFQKMWGQDSLDLLQNRHILPPTEIIPPKPKLQAEQWNGINCSRDIFRCTLSKIPETDSLLKKARLPLGVLIHPYKDLSHLPVIQCSTIVRCRSCRTYINPFVHFVDQRRWRCNLCYRVNELPEEFLYDPVSKSYGDPSRRPECKSSTIEFIAPQEYMLRPPQPAVYLFLLDVSRQALESGYLRNFCDIMLDELDKLPGDSRTQVGFITYNRSLQFYMIPEGASQASQLVVGDVEDVFLPSPSDLLVNLQSCKEQIVQMLNELPELFNGSQDTENCLGAALQAAYKMICPTGGRITVVQCTLPNIGPGALKNREGGQSKEGLDSGLLNPSTDFYKKLALECSGQQIAVDCFVLNNQHLDLASISGISKFSGGQVEAFPGYHSLHNLPVAERFDRSLRRYLTRKIGFESVMRIRCTRGMSLHTFHGHFFVRSTDLLALPNVNPDAGFGMQVSIDEDLKDSREVSFQAALLYTSSKGERRIRVHTLCIPISSNLQEIIQGADQQCIIGLLTKMAVDRSLNSSLSDAKEAFINACVDTISRWKQIQCVSQPGVLPVHPNLRLLPLYILALLKSPAFTARSGVKLDDRTMSLIKMKCLPLTQLIQSIYPDLYRVDNLELAKTQEDEEGVVVSVPDRLQLSAENISLSGVYLMDRGDTLILYLGKVTSQFFCEKIFGVRGMTEVEENLTDLPELDNEDSERLRTFVQFLNNNKSHPVPVQIVRDDQKSRMLFINQLVDDRSESSFSYYEFLQHLKTLVK